MLFLSKLFICTFLWYRVTGVLKLYIHILVYCLNNHGTFNTLSNLFRLILVSSVEVTN